MSSSAKDAFKQSRAMDTVLELKIGSESIPMLLTYKGVREAAKNWQTYSSDAPFRVPIPSEENQRSVRQLPIETDPPVHQTYRRFLEPFFRRPLQAEYVAKIDDLVRNTSRKCAESGSFDVVREFALPLQSRALSLLLGVPRQEAETWIDWGIHVFHDGADSAAKGEHLTVYLRDAIAAARGVADPNNFFAALNQFEIGNRPLSDDEKLGIANLVFAGGRDTVIHTITFLIAHFANHPEALRALARSPKAINLAVEESVRIVSPLTHIGRICKHATPEQTEAGQRVSLCWAAANYDPEIFPNPERIDFERMPNPHVGFGSGHHACLGAAQARAIFRSLIGALVDLDVGIELGETAPRYEQIGTIQRQVGFDRLIASFKLGAGAES